MTLENASTLRACCIAILLFVASVSSAQIAPERTLDELKAETLSRVERNAYPAANLKLDDAREALSNIHSLAPDEWASAWSAIGNRYRAQAMDSSGDAARDLYYRAFLYYSLARFPTPNSPGKKAAYTQAIDAYLRYAQFAQPKLEVVHIPFEGKEIIGYLRLPDSPRPAPVMLMWGGIDFLKEQAADNLLPMVHQGIAAFSIDMPGTGQAPIKADVNSERMFSRVLDYLQSRPEIDGKRMMIWGASWGGYWTVKLAVTERARLLGAIDQGGPVDAYFQPEWQLKALGTREYLMGLFDARAAIYEHVHTLDEFLAACSRMSLLKLGILDQPSAPMLLFDGALDTQVPISDLTILLMHGSIKQAWVNPQGRHVAQAKDWPNSRMTSEIVMPWVRDLLASKSGL